MNNESGPLVDIVRRIYGAFVSSDLDTIIELVDPAVVIIQDPALPWGGRYDGLEGLNEFSTKLQRTITSVVTTEVLFQAGDTVIQQGRTSGTVLNNGAPFDIPECHIWTIRGGRALQARFYIDTPAMVAALLR
jgi:uncharacterized protein